MLTQSVPWREGATAARSRLEQEGDDTGHRGSMAAGRSPRSGESGSGGGDSGPVGGDSRKVQSHQLLAQVNNVASRLGVIFKGC